MKRLKGCWCVALLALIASPALAQLPEAGDRPALRLPPALPDGRPLRPIALFLSQLDELIPDDYRPVSIDQLNEAITRLTDRARASRRLITGVSKTLEFRGCQGLPSTS